MGAERRQGQERGQGAEAGAHLALLVTLPPAHAGGLDPALLLRAAATPRTTLACDPPARAAGVRICLQLLTWGPGAIAAPSYEHTGCPPCGGPGPWPQASPEPQRRAARQAAPRSGAAADRAIYPRAAGVRFCLQLLTWGPGAIAAPSYEHTGCPPCGGPGPWPQASPEPQRRVARQAAPRSGAIE